MRISDWSSDVCSSDLCSWMITFEYTDIRFRESLRGAPPDGEAVGLPGGLAQARHVSAHGGFAQLVAAQAELGVHGARAAGQGAAGGLARGRGVARQLLPLDHSLHLLVVAGRRLADDLLQDRKSVV